MFSFSKCYLVGITTTMTLKTRRISKPLEKRTGPITRSSRFAVYPAMVTVRRTNMMLFPKG